jgi:hypothetical protein
MEDKKECENIFPWMRHGRGEKLLKGSSKEKCFEKFRHAFCCLYFVCFPSRLKKSPSKSQFCSNLHREEITEQNELAHQSKWMF